MQLSRLRGDDDDDDDDDNDNDCTKVQFVPHTKLTASELQAPNT